MSRVALLSVSDKTGILELAQVLVQQYGFRLISSGGTAQALQQAGIPVTQVAEYTGAPEMLGGRVKTLHPRIHGGILARLDVETDVTDLAAQEISAIELVVVNLYPFEATVARPDTSLAEAIEKIDIGGPTLVRAAAKNYAHVTVLTDPGQYPDYLQTVAQQGSPDLDFRFRMAQQAFSRILAYDYAIAQYLHHQDPLQQGGGAAPYLLHGIPHQILRYGENPQQTSTWYADGSLSGSGSGWAGATLVQGKPLSYNNLMDLEAARAVAAEFLSDPSSGEQSHTDPAAAVIIKHANPCGVALGATLVDAYRSAVAADPVSAFGGIVALTRPLDSETAEALTDIFLECVVAPGCSEEAAQVLRAKKNLRLLILPTMATGPAQQIRMIAGGFLVQESDDQPLDPSAWKVVTQEQPSPEEWAEALFAWKVCKHVKSNAIVVTQDRRTLGIGAGQMNRVGSVQLALHQAGERAVGGVLASDGFFPFGDSVQTAAGAGIRVIVQPGGSLRDEESIAVANQAGIAMIMTGIRHFWH